MRAPSNPAIGAFQSSAECSENVLTLAWEDLRGLGLCVRTGIVLQWFLRQLLDTFPLLSLHPDPELPGSLVLHESPLPALP